MSNTAEKELEKNCGTRSMQFGMSMEHIAEHVIEWEYEHHENGSGVARRWATKAMCICGKVVEL